MMSDFKSNTQQEKPHILFLLADDLGWNDFSHNKEANSPIPSPNVEKLAAAGIQLQQHYMHNFCTPSRAALLTGRYHVNTGLIFVLTPGTPAGIPTDIPTLPEVLKEKAGYKTAMVGKWHLGHSQHKVTPTGRGFESFTGIYMWDTDSYLKQMVELPWEGPLMIDWVKEYSNGTYYHYAEPRHATEAIVSEVQLVMNQHAEQLQTTNRYQPLFMYISFTAAHSPLQPMPQHAVKCNHIPHLWRRQFCGMVVGFDEAVKNITEHAKAVLGENVLVVITADNGGSPWFGGNNMPLRGSKGTPFEGGHKVPAIITDFTVDQRYLLGQPTNASAVEQQHQQQQHRLYHGMMHVSDWMPTLLTYAGVDKTEFPSNMDGYDFSNVFRHVPYSSNGDPKSANFTRFTDTPRNELHYDLQPQSESMFNQSLLAHRIGNYKLIKGIVRDTSYYYESITKDRMNCSNPTWTTYITENVLRFADSLFGNNKFDLARIAITHQFMQDILSQEQGLNAGAEGETGEGSTMNRLYNVIDDPNETTNLYNEPWAKPIIEEIEKRVQEIDAKRPPSQKAYYQMDLKDDWPKTLVSGDCSMNPAIPEKYCRFAHPWIRDDEDPWKHQFKLINAHEYSRNKLKRAVMDMLSMGFLVLLICMFLYRCLKRRNTTKAKKL